MIKENIDKVRQNIINACERSGRKADDVTLIAVSKTKPVEMINEAIKAGQRVFGENRVQELAEKFDILSEERLDWHLIGHLQRNKVKYIIDKASLIHSVDSLRLAGQISVEAVKRGITAHILIEVNAALEDTKFGVRPEDCESLVREISVLPGIVTDGLMTVAPYTDNAEDNRCYFRKLRELSVDIRGKNIDNVSMNVLSMGMTGDYEVAIEEGATHVRVGTGIFGTR